MKLSTILIGNQTWASSNLDVTHYSNGEPIYHAKNPSEWTFFCLNNIGCFCFYNYNADYAKYGKMYNWQAVNDLRGLAPEGYRVPKDEDWDILIDYLGGVSVAGTKLKATNRFIENNEPVSDEYKFGALPSGYHGGGNSQLLGFNAHWWTATPYLQDFAWLRYITHDSNFIGRSFDYKSSGFAVRCVKMEPIDEVVIGKQTWMKQNLNEIKFSNGDDIFIANSASDLIKCCRMKILACCNYDFNKDLGNVFGKLYNWYAVNDPRGLCQSGWQVPSDNEWTALCSFLGHKVAGSKLKAVSDLWAFSNVVSNNETQFNALPAGYFGDGYFNTLHHNAVFWSSSEYLNEYAWLRLLTYNSSVMDRGFDYKKGGYSIRCIKTI